MALGATMDVGVSDKTLNGYKQCLKEIVDRTYSGKENRMDMKMPAYVLESSMFGELCLTRSVNPHNGKMRVGYMPVRWVEKVNPDPFDPSEPDSIVLRGGVDWVQDRRHKDGGRIDFTGEATTRKVVRYNSEPWKYDLNGKLVLVKDEMGMEHKVKNPDYGKLTGDVFYSRLPNLLSVDRGRGDTFAVADWINKLDQGIYDFLDRYNTQAAVVFDLLIKGGSKDDIEKASKMRLPTGNRPYAHNEMHVLTLLSANIKIEDLTNFIRTMVVLIAGTCLLPGTEIVTRRGVVPIEDVVAGDYVISHKGKWRKVIETMANDVGDKKCVEITSQFAPLYCTEDHPIYAANFQQNRTHKCEVESCHSNLREICRRKRYAGILTA
jgi:hypothetical protein